MSKKETMVDKGLISQEIQDKADKIKESLHFDPATGAITADKGLFEQHLPEDTKIKDIKNAIAVIGDFVTAANVAVTGYAIDSMAKHKDIDSTTAKLQLLPGGNDVTFTTKRHTSGPIPGKEGERWNKYGQTSTVVSLRLAEGTKAAQKGMQDYWSEEASDKLKK